jgi:hypothetical protein
VRRGPVPGSRRGGIALKQSLRGDSESGAVETDRITDFRDVLRWDDSQCHRILLIMGELVLGAARPVNDAHRTGWTGQMSGARRHSVKRDGDGTRPQKSWRQIGLALVGELGHIELSILLLVLTADIIAATVVWSIVGSLLR